MTVIGAAADLDRAFIWADSEIFNRDTERSAGHEFKISINERSGVAAVGAGDTGGSYHIAGMVARAHSFDDLCLRMPKHLSEWAADRVDAGQPWPDWICAAVGFSCRHRRMMAGLFCAPSRFTLSYATHFTSPSVSERASEIINLAGPADVVPLALDQLSRLRFTPLSDGRNVLTVAEVRRGSASVRAFDLATAVELPALPDAPPMGQRAKDIRRRIFDSREEPKIIELRRGAA